MKNVNVFDSGLMIALMGDVYEVTSKAGVMVKVPVLAFEEMCRMEKVKDGVVMSKIYEPDDDEFVEVYRNELKVGVTVGGECHEILPDEAQSLKELIFGKYSYQPGYDFEKLDVDSQTPPAEVTARGDDYV